MEMRVVKPAPDQGSGLCGAMFKPNDVARIESELGSNVRKHRFR
jgi:hypothetical protein